LVKKSTRVNCANTLEALDQYLKLQKIELLDQITVETLSGYRVQRLESNGSNSQQKPDQLAFERLVNLPKPLHALRAPAFATSKLSPYSAPAKNDHRHQ
jgi:hypothetical protein